MPCMFQLLTGLYCPGCGGTRAVRYLMQGRLLMSLRYHPLVPYMAAAAAAESISYLASRVLGKPEYYLGHEKELIAIGIAITAANWIVKNVLLVCFGVDLLSVPL